MSSFGAKNILRHDITTQDMFFNDGQSIVDYLSKAKPQFLYKSVSTQGATAKRLDQHSPLEIKAYIKEYIMVYKSRKSVVMKEYLCDCNPCLRLGFGNCENGEGKQTGEEMEVSIHEQFLMKILKEIMKSRSSILLRFLHL